MSKWIDDVFRSQVSEVPFITQEEAALRRVRDAGAEVSPHTVRLILGPVLEALAASEAKVARVKALMVGTPRRIKGEEGEGCEPHTYVLEAAIRNAIADQPEVSP